MNIYKEKEGSINTDGLCIPTDPDNRYYAAILAEVEAGEASIEHYEGSAEQEADEASQAALEAVQEAKAYLDSTDWYAIRRAETKKSIPKEVLDKRKEARKIAEGGGK